MYMSTLVQRAYTLSDLQNTQSIQYSEIVSSSNEVWQQIYATLLSSNDDYVLKTFTTSLSAATKAENGTSYLIPLPDDFYRLRTVSWQGMYQYLPMRKFAESQRDDFSPVPMYRIQNNDLIITGAFMPSFTGNILVKYYPEPTYPTVPFPTINYGYSYQPYELKNITSVIFAQTYVVGQNSPNNVMAYLYNGTQIVSESDAFATIDAPVNIYTSGVAISNLRYYEGYFYFLDAGNVYSLPTNLQDIITATPTQLTTIGTITSFSVSGDLIYYTDGTNTYSMLLDGTGVVSIGAFASSYVNVINSIPFYINSGSVNYWNGTAEVIIYSGSTVTSMTSDGTNLFIVNSDGNLMQLQLLDTTGVYSVSLNTFMLDKVSTVNSYSENYLGLQMQNGKLEAFSAILDYNFTYPLNVIYQIIAYQMAIDFCRKYGSVEHLQTLTARSAELWKTFMAETNRRDDYQGERINNTYREGYGGFGGYY